MACERVGRRPIAVLQRRQQRPFAVGGRYLHQPFREIISGVTGETVLAPENQRIPCLAGPTAQQQRFQVTQPVVGDLRIGLQRDEQE